MTERAIEIRERIRDDRVHYRDSILTLRESHIVMNVLQTLEAYEKENAELRERLDKAVELPCKLGSPLYVIDETRDTDTWELKPCVIHKYYAAEVTVCENGDFLFQVETSTSHKRLRFGEDIFTTRAEAEARLKELQGGVR